MCGHADRAPSAEPPSGREDRETGSTCALSDLSGVPSARTSAAARTRCTQVHRDEDISRTDLCGAPGDSERTSGDAGSGRRLRRRMPRATVEAGPTFAAVSTAPVQQRRRDATSGARDNHPALVVTRETGLLGESIVLASRPGRASVHTAHSRRSTSRDVTIGELLAPPGHSGFPLRPVTTHPHGAGKVEAGGPYVSRADRDERSDGHRSCPSDRKTR